MRMCVYWEESLISISIEERECGFLFGNCVCKFCARVEDTMCCYKKHGEDGVGKECSEFCEDFVPAAAVAEQWCIWNPYAVESAWYGDIDDDGYERDDD